MKLVEERMLRSAARAASYRKYQQEVSFCVPWFPRSMKRVES
jgi:protein-S-isoprenylcysteine O-methyltransferase Ste14